MGIKVSIVTPFFNGLQYLEACVNSVLVQTLPELELILVDDGSTDSSGVLADELAKKNSRVKVIHQTNKGVSAARNVGLKIAQGEYIGFVDADDFIEPQIVETLYKAATEFLADIVHAGYLINNSKDRSTNIVTPSFETGKILNHEDIKQQAVKMHSTGCFLFVWRNLFSHRLIAENSIRFDEEISFGEDTLFCMACFLKAEKAVSLDLAGYHYRIHPESVMKQRFKPLLTSSLQNQFKQKLGLCEKYFPDCLELFCNDMAKYNITALFPLMLANIYQNDTSQKLNQLKSLAKSEMMSTSFADFDLAEIRSKSLDWLMFWFVKNKLYFIAHLLCKHILYKN